MSNILDEAKTRPQESLPTAVEVYGCKLYIQSLHQHPEVAAQLKKFILSKIESPASDFGSKDYKFKAGDLKGYKHAGLTYDISIVYTMEGRDPAVLKLYGVFTHDELGTGSTPNRKRQDSMATKFSNQQFVKVPLK